MPTAEDVDDARLLDLSRVGDAAAFDLLRQRHEHAARRLARDLVLSPAEIDDVLDETFARILAVLRRGGGPRDAFRPYVLTATRRVGYDRLLAQRRKIPTAELERADPGDAFVDVAVASLDKSLMAQAFMSLPERFSAVLWHTEIEGATAAEVAPLFGLTGTGLTGSGVAALRQRAQDGLRQTYIRMYVARTIDRECKPVAQRLGTFVRDALSSRETATVSQHLSVCAECEAAYADLIDVSGALRDVVAPIFLGSAAAPYLAKAVESTEDSALGLLAGARTGPADSGPIEEIGRGIGAPDTGPAAVGRLASGGTSRLRRVPSPVHWIAAGAVTVVAVFAIAFAVTLTGNHTATGPRHQQPRGTAALSPVVVSASAQASGQASRQVHRRSQSPSTAATSSSASPSTQPAVPTSPATSVPTVAAQLSASIDVGGGHHWGNFQQVDFQVTNTGSGATGALTATITLPAGARMFTGGGDHHGNAGAIGNRAAFDGGSGWNCQPTSAGAVCQHAALAAGAHTAGAILIEVMDAAACGQPAEVAAASGSLSASAQSPGGISCSEGD
jgi:DNA-directed RNA polymerase specialized sigma24 family protein